MKRNILNLLFFVFVALLSYTSISFAAVDRVRSLAEQAMQKVSSDDYYGGIQLFEEVLREVKSDNDARLIAGFLQMLELTNMQAGVYYFNRSNYRESVKFFMAAQGYAEQRGNRENEESILDNIRKCFAKLGNKEKEIEYAKKLVQVAKNAGNKKRQVSMTTYIGTLYFEWGDFDQALSFAQEGLNLSRAYGLKEEEAHALNNLANAYSKKLDYPQAIHYAKLSLQLKQAQDLQKDSATTLLNLGCYYHELGDTRQAFTYYEQALKIATDLGNHEIITSIYSNYGKFYAQVADYQQSLAYCKKGIKLAEDSGNAALQKLLLVYAASICRQSGDLDKAEAYLEHAKKIGSVSDDGRIDAQLKLIYYRQGQMEKLSSLCLRQNDALCEYMQKHYADAKNRFIHMALDAEEIRHAELLLTGYTGLASTWEALKDYQRAREYFKKAADLTEKERAGLTEAQKTNFFGAEILVFGNRLAPYEGLVRTSEFTAGGLRDALYYSEFTKSRLYMEATAKKYGVPETRIPHALAQEETRLINNVAALSKQMDVAFLQKNKPLYAKLEKDMAQLEREQHTFISRLRRDYPEYAAVMYPLPVYVEQVPLRQEEVVIEYEMTEPYTKVFVIKGGKIVFNYNVAATREQLTAYIKMYRSFFENVESTVQLAKYDPALGKQLYDLLLNPALTCKGKDGKPVISATSRIIIIPDETLGLLPFESLVISMSDNKKQLKTKFGVAPAGVRYVGDAYSITYAQSLTALTAQRALKKKRGTDKAILVLADPVFSPADNRLRGANYDTVKNKPTGIQAGMTAAIVNRMGVGGKRGKSDDTEEMPPDQDVCFPRLDKTSILADELKNRIFAGAAADVLSGMKAKKENLEKMNLARYKYLVFATHGILDDAVPYIREPALVLSQVGNQEQRNGFLTMSEVMGFKLNANVVALTACQTGLGKNVSGEGVMGMGRSFQYSGAQSALVSLWSVAEDSTTMLAAKFFTYLKAGKSNREALQHARADVRRAGYEHPFYWSPFILFGD